MQHFSPICCVKLDLRAEGVRICVASGTRRLLLQGKTLRGEVLFRVSRKPPAQKLFLAHSKCVIITLITHLDEAHHDTPDTAHRKHSATLTDEQRERVADALENEHSENTRRNYAG